MKVLVLSDTHGSLEVTSKVFELVGKVDLVFHLGDVLYHGPRNPIPRGYDPMGLAEFLREKRVIYVRGNCDADVDLMVLGLQEIPRMAMEYFENLKVLLLHGDQLEEMDVVSFAKEHGCQVVLFGHTHVPTVEKREGVLLLNPGSPSLPKSQHPGTCGLIDTETGCFSLFNTEGSLIKEVRILDGS